MDVLVVDTLPADVLAWLAGRHRVRVAAELAREPAALRRALAGAHAAVLPPSVALDGPTLWRAPHLRVVGRVSAGLENIDTDACARAGVELVRAHAATANAEAEFVIGALLALLRRVPVITEDGLLVGRELGASQVGLVGYTPGAEALARLLGALGAEVVGYDPGLHASESSWSPLGVRPVSLQELVRDSDAVCVLMAHYQRYDGLFGERLLDVAKPDQVWVSLSHSKLFDEQALARALRQGPLAAAWLDSLEPGALDEGRPLRHIDTLQVTPRVGSTTRESRQRSAWVVAQRIDAVLAGIGDPKAVRPQMRGVRAGP
jgi:D-3-phosphoglycerate dehydrogenase / 2-oxoglutarate reductase